MSVRRVEKMSAAFLKWPSIGPNYARMIIPEKKGTKIVDAKMYVRLYHEPTIHL
jgi:hypothetical protein